MHVRRAAAQDPTCRGGAGIVTVQSMDVLRKLAAEKPGTVYYCAYTGSSMHPTLCERDLLEVGHYGCEPVRAGDVILWLPPEADQPIVHRVVHVGSEGIRTRGDNNGNDDPWILLPEDVIGRVLAARRDLNRRRIAGGRMGQLQSRTIRWSQVLARGASRLLHPIYHALARPGIVRRLLPDHLVPRVAVFRANGHSQQRLLLGRRSIGLYDSRRERWDIERPFRLFVDEGSLPQSPSLTSADDIPR